MKREGTFAGKLSQLLDEMSGKGGDRPADASESPGAVPTEVVKHLLTARLHACSFFFPRVSALHSSSRPSFVPMCIQSFDFTLVFLVTAPCSFLLVVLPLLHHYRHHCSADFVFGRQEDSHELYQTLLRCLAQDATPSGAHFSVADQVDTHTHTHAHTSTHAHTHTHARTRTHTHTHTAFQTRGFLTLTLAAVCLLSFCHC